MTATQDNPGDVTTNTKRSGRLTAVQGGGGRPAGPPAPPLVRRLADKFLADGRAHYKVTFNEEGREIRSEIVNARVRILAAYADDTAEPYPLAETETAERTQSVVTHYDLNVSRTGEEPVILADVPVEDFAKVAWVDRAELSGLPVLTASGATAKQDIATAIKSSAPYAIVPAYGKLGWHFRGGRWMYVHGGGAWDANGAVPDVRVHGDGLATFTMSPPPSTDDDGRRAFDALWSLFEMGPDRWAAVEIGAAFRASMGRPVGSITYLAINQSGKSGRAAFITQCWAPGVRWRRLPFNAGKDNATPSYIEGVHHTFGDMIVVWDDMAPVGTAMERALYFDRFARSLFNSSSKGRMDRGMKARARLRPRAFGVLTAEDISAVESGQNRTHVISLSREEFDAAAFGAADQGTGPADRSALMSAFVIWWASKMPAHANTAEREAEFARKLSEATGAPSRYVESVADKAAGLMAGLEFALTKGWVDQARSDELWARGWSGLVESLHEQVRAMDGQAMHERILAALLDGLASHEAHVLGMDGDVPGLDPISLGWDAQGRAQGRHIGWTDTERLFLLPSAAGAFVSVYTARNGTPIEITYRAMGEALKGAGLVLGSTSRGKDGRPVNRSTTPKKILGQKRDVWSLRWSPEPEHAPEPEATPLPAAPTPVPEGKLPTPQTCVGCGELTTWQQGGVPLHAGGFCEIPAPVESGAVEPLPAPAPAAPTPAPAESSSRLPRAAKPKPTPQAGKVLAVAADRDGIYLTGGEVIAPGDSFDSMPAFLASVAALMPGGGSVAITAEVAAVLGFQDVPASNLQGAKLTKAKACRAITEAAAAGWQSSKDGLGAWSSWYGEDRPDIAVLVIEWIKTDRKSTEKAQLVKSDDSVAAALYKLSEFRARIGEPYKMSTGTVCTNLIKNMRDAMPKARRPQWKWAGQELPMGIKQGPIVWSRALTEEERSMGFVIPFDLRRAYLAGLVNANLAVKPLVHEGIAGGFDKTRAGYWLVPGVWQPYEMLPDLTGGMDWLPTPLVSLCLANGMPEEMIQDAWLAPGLTAHTLRLTLEPANRIRDALAALPDGLEGPDAEIQAAIKGLYSEGVGMLGTTRTLVQRRDWADTTLATVKLAFLSKVIEVGKTSGRWPVELDTDCAYYASNQPEAGADNPGFPLYDPTTPDKDLGRYVVKPKDIRTMADYLTAKGGK